MPCYRLEAKKKHCCAPPVSPNPIWSNYANTRSNKLNIALQGHRHFQKTTGCPATDWKRKRSIVVHLLCPPNPIWSNDAYTRSNKLNITLQGHRHIPKTTRCPATDWKQKRSIVVHLLCPPTSYGPMMPILDKKK